ncbi:MAG: hypothetical protein KDK70_11445 [Myxococcales bacterium]|nr:hypothetical protein [Myxococcales bacterium]
MHPSALAAARPRPASISLRALLAEPGGRRRLVQALDDVLDRAGSPASMDDQQLLLRAGDLLDRGRLHDLDV